MVMVETANGYVLCAAHASAWRRRGNDVGMRPAAVEVAAVGCADCADDAAPTDGEAWAYAELAALANGGAL